MPRVAGSSSERRCTASLAARTTSVTEAMVATFGIEAGLDGLERDRAGHLAGGVATHAVGHREHARRGEHPVLVGLADAARIGRGAPPELGHQPSPMGRAVMRSP